MGAHQNDYNVISFTIERRETKLAHISIKHALAAREIFSKKKSKRIRNAKRNFEQTRS